MWCKYEFKGLQKNIDSTVTCSQCPHLVRAANIVEASISKFRRLLPQGRRPFPESAQARLQGGVLGVHRLIFLLFDLGVVFFYFDFNYT